MAFHVGQKVVCVDDDDGSSALIKKGRIYTISAIVGGYLEFCERDTWSANGYKGWYAWRFRPVVEPKTDISIFTAMLTPKKATEPA